MATDPETSEQVADRLEHLGHFAVAVAETDSRVYGAFDLDCAALEILKATPQLARWSFCCGCQLVRMGEVAVATGRCRRHERMGRRA